MSPWGIGSAASSSILVEPMRCRFNFVAPASASPGLLERLLKRPPGPGSMLRSHLEHNNGLHGGPALLRVQ